MKIVVLFDGAGTIHALFQPSAEADAPQLQFRPDAGQRVETLEVPAELRHLQTAALHKALRVDLGGGAPRLVTHGKG